jgi:DNA repair exonuclease SbcCD ATPase subunit
VRVHRIRLGNYRGVAGRDIQINPYGVTVIEGPNEIGKSSLSEALSLIFEQLDSTKKTQIKLIKPVDRDAGPEVEVEIETGPYRFTYFKRFLKKPETTLSVTAPRPENYTGREAHDRANAILAESMDIDLWKALCVDQGTAIEQANLTTTSSLAEALDRAAGHEVAGERETNIFEAAHREYNLYFTTGTCKETGVLKKTREAVEQAQRTEAGLKKELEGIDELVERSTVLDREIKSLEEQAAETEKRAEQRETEQKQVEEQANLVEQRERAWKQTAELEARAETDHETRVSLVTKVEDSETRVQELKTALENDVPSLKKADGAAQKLAEELSSAEQTAKEAQKDAELRRADNEYHRAKLDLDQLTERRQRIESARQKAKDADELLESTKITNELLDQIKATSRKFERAQAQLDAGSPRLLVTALKDFTIEVDGEPQRIAQGESLDEKVGESTRLRVPEVVEVEVHAGTSLDTLVRNRDSHQETLQKLFDSASVSSQEEAGKANLARLDAERTVEDSERITEENLRDLSIDEMDAKIDRLKDRVSSYPKGRVDEPALPEDFDSSTTLKIEAEKHYEQAQSAVRAIEVNHEVVESKVGDRDPATQILDVDHLFLKSLELPFAIGQIVHLVPPTLLDDVFLTGRRDVEQHHPAGHPSLKVDVLVELHVGPEVH